MGQKARVTVELPDKTKLKGYFSNASSASFTVIDSKGTSRALAYSDVSRVRKQKGGGTAAATVIVFATVIRPVLCDGGAGC
jgi:hypothetical protein